MVMIRTITILSTFVAFAANAGDFSVQIGSYKNPDRAKIESQVPDDAGELHSSTTRSGIIRFEVGPFSSMTEAEAALEKLRNAGFSDAFIRQATYEEAVPAGIRSRHDDALLSSLSEEERRNVVYLDGRLHKKIGDEFIPLNEDGR